MASMKQKEEKWQISTTAEDHSKFLNFVAEGKSTQAEAFAFLMKDVKTNDDGNHEGTGKAAAEAAGGKKTRGRKPKKDVEEEEHHFSEDEFEETGSPKKGKRTAGKKTSPVKASAADMANATFKVDEPAKMKKGQVQKDAEFVHEEFDEPEVPMNTKSPKADKKDEGGDAPEPKKGRGKAAAKEAGATAPKGRGGRKAAQPAPVDDGAPEEMEAATNDGDKQRGKRKPAKEKGAAEGKDEVDAKKKRGRKPKAKAVESGEDDE